MREKIKFYLGKFDVYWLMLLAFLLRVFYRGSSTYGVTGELYRDLTVVYDFVHFHRWPLLGPSSSLGGFNFGAIYYYFLAPFAWLFRFAPYGATAVGLIASVLSLWMLYKLLELWFSGKNVARLGALLLAVSMLDIQNSYYISNPNIMPLFILWFFYCLTHLASGQKDWKYYAGLGLSLGVATQLHATALLLLPLVGVAVLIIIKPKLRWQGLALAAILAALLYAPYIIFELSHHFVNTRDLLGLGQKNYGLLIQPASIVAIATFWQSWLLSRASFFDIFELHFMGAAVLLCAFMALLVFVVYKYRKNPSAGFLAAPSRAGQVIFWLWLGLGTLMFLLFQHGIQHFYFLVLWPAPIILFAWFLENLRQYRLLAAGLVALYIIMQAWQLWYFYPQAYIPAFDHKNLLADFSGIENRTNGQTFNVFSKELDVDQFAYYKLLTGMDKKITKTQASELITICSVNDPAGCTINNPGYHQTGLWTQNGLQFASFQK